MEGNKINHEAVNEEELLSLGYRKYTGEKMDIYYNKDICAHIGNCVRGKKEVFEVGRRPWIIPDNGDNETNARVINTCPTGALKFIYKEEI